MGTRDDLLALLIAAAREDLLGGGGRWGAVTDAVLAAGWRPPSVVVTSVEDLDDLPDHTVVLDSDGGVWGVNEQREWCELATAGLDADEIVHWGPFVVVSGPNIAAPPS